MPFGQLVVGPPGSGKTTYCRGMQQFLEASGRKVAIVNLDPANDSLPYEAAVDIAGLVCLEEVMRELGLGPNGGLIYCMDYLEQNLDWLKEQLAPLEKDNTYLLIDCPGQVELFMTHGSLKRVLDTMTSQWHYRLVALQLVDAHLCTDPAKYISALLLSLNTMLMLELPHLNVLSKIDLVQQYGKLDLNLDFYTEVQDLSYLLQAMGSKPFSQKYRKLSKGLCEVVEEYGLVSFLPLSVQERESMARLVIQADKANGYCFATLRGHTPYPPEILYGSASGAADRDIWASLQERYVDGDVRERGEGGEGEEGAQGSGEEAGGRQEQEGAAPSGRGEGRAPQRKAQGEGEGAGGAGGAGAGEGRAAAPEGFAWAKGRAGRAGGRTDG